MTKDQRLERLEAEHGVLRQRLRRTERAFLALALVAGSSLLLAAMPIDPTIEEIVRTERLEIVANRSDPRVLVSIGPSPEGRGMINAFGDDGRLLFSMRPDPQGRGALRTFNQDGYPLFETAAGTDGLGWLAVSDGAGQELAGFIPVNDTGSILLSNREGIRIAEAFASDAQTGIFRLYHANGTPSLSMSHDANQDGLLVTYDAAGNMMATLGSGEAGGSLGLVDWGTKTVERFGKPLVEDATAKPDLGGDERISDKSDQSRGR